MSPDQASKVLAMIAVAGALASVLLPAALLKWAGELIFAGRLP